MTASTFNMLRQPPVTIISEKKIPEKPSVKITAKKQQKRPKQIEIEQIAKKAKKPKDITPLTELLKQMPKGEKKTVTPIQTSKPVSKPAAKKSTPITREPVKADTPKPERKLAEPVNKEPTKIAAPTHQKKPAEPAKSEPIKRSVQTPETKPAEPKLSTPKPLQKVKAPIAWNPILSKYMRKMRNDIGLKRVMFAMISDSNTQARICELVGADVSSGLNRFAVNIQEENLFKLLLSKQQGFWLKPSNQEKFLPMIPNEVMDSIDQSGFFCMSLFARGKPFGLIYADGTYALNDDSYADFKTLCAEMSMALGQVKT